MKRKSLNEYNISDTSTLKPAEYSNVTQGLKRLQYRIKMANTPVKILDCIKLAHFLVEGWPLKSKIIWQTFSQSWKARTPEAEPEVPEVPESSEEEIDDFSIE